MEEGKFSIKKLVAHNKLHPNTIKLLKEKKDENEGEEVVLSDDSSREAVSSDDGSSEEVRAYRHRTRIRNTSKCSSAVGDVCILASRRAV